MSMTHDEMIAVIQAHKEGKAIQVFDNYKGMWVDISCPYWNFSACKYRVKPEARPDKVVPVRSWITPVGDLVLYSCTQNADLFLTFDCETGKLKSAEVLP